MSRSKTRGPGRGLPWGLVGMLAIVAVVERAVDRHGLDFAEVTAVNWGYSKRATHAEAPRTDILCLGTSLVKFGVLPRALEDATGRSAYNLAVCNGHMPSSYFLLKRALDAGARPAAIVIDCQDGPVTAEHRHEQAEALRVNLRNWPELLNPGECLDLAWTAGDASFFGATSVAKVLPSYKARFEVRNVVKAAFEGGNASQRDVIIPFLRNWNANLGTNVMPSTVTVPENSAPIPPGFVAVADHFADGRWSRNTLTARYTHRLLALAEARDIPVFWLLPPVTPPAFHSRHIDGYDSYFDGLAREAQAIYPNVTVIDGSRSGYPPDAFCDKAHLNAKGTVVFSQGVASVVARALTDPRAGSSWVTLPGFAEAERRTASWFEDINASRLAVKEGRGGVRR